MIVNSEHSRSILPSAVKSPGGQHPAHSVRVAVSGATGYAGQELIRLLAQHPAVEIAGVGSRSYEGMRFSSVFPGFRKQLDDIVCSADDIEQLADSCEILFLALPHGLAASRVTEAVLSKAKVIDLSGDFRIASDSEYEQWFGEAHANPALIAEAVYGLCELNRDTIKQARLVANPGCYATAAVLSLAPLVRAGLIEENSIIIDGKSGVSGAGRSASLPVHFSECHESVRAYKAPSHRHTPEIEQALGRLTSQPIRSTFAAHLVPMNRGILLTAYATLKTPVPSADIQSVFRGSYGDEPFLRVLEPDSGLPETRWVLGSNYCDIGFALDERCGRIVVVSAIDNLVKGAAGQAVQNMNILLGLDERVGLGNAPLFPA